MKGIYFHSDKRTPESVSERPESSTVDSFLQPLLKPTPEPMGKIEYI